MAGSKLLQEMRAVLRRKHYSTRTEQAYCEWVRRFVKFHRMKNRDQFEGGEKKVEQFLTHLAADLKVSPSTQNQAFSALLFLYNHVLQKPLQPSIQAQRAPERIRIPVVLTREETARIIAALSGIHQLVVKILYGSGLRILECLRLRVQDIDFAMNSITVKDGKGQKDRITTYPKSITPVLQEHLQRVRIIHERDLADGFGEVYLPHALGRKYPSAAKKWGWQYVFPSKSRSKDPRSGAERRHHLDPSPINKAIQRAAKLAGVNKALSAHTFRHSFATHLLQRGTDIRTIQALLGHKDVSTTMVYTHVLKQSGQGVVSPLDDLPTL